MDTLPNPTPAALPALSERASQELRAARSLAQLRLAADRLTGSQTVLLIPVSQPSGLVALVGHAAAAEALPYLAFAREPLAAYMSNLSPAGELRARWGELLDLPGAESSRPPVPADAHCIIVRAPGSDGAALGISNLGPSSLSLLQEVAHAVSEVVGPLLRAELLSRELDQMRLAQQAGLQLIAAMDQPAFLSELAEFLSRIFGFRRIYIALLHHASQTYRGELHTGFDESFRPFTIASNRLDSLFIRTIGEGRVRYSERGQPPESELAVFGGEKPVERYLLAPLKTGSQPLGFIYADQPRTDEVFFSRTPLESFVTLAGAALANLATRLGAERRAETDPLTGVRNRAYLDRILEFEIPRIRRYKSAISMLMIDLCDFKKINDTYGHIFGDHILRETASILQGNVREPDVVVRYGGDEFVVLMVNTNVDQAQLVRQRIERAFIERNRAQDDEKMMIDISVGLSSADHATIGTLLADADRSMYVHKTEHKKQQLAQTLLEFPAGRPEIVDSVISSLLSNLRNKDPRYKEHSRRVAHLCLWIAGRLELSPPEIRTLVIAALLHDVGKASLPAEILSRPGPLTESEQKAVQGHPVLGEEFLQNLNHLEEARPLIRHHHERFDGRTSGEFPGYPHGLAGDAIPLGARILKLADSVDAILSGRPYRPARSLAETIQIIRSESGASFDPRLARVLLTSDRWHENLGDPQALEALFSGMLSESAEAEPSIPADAQKV